MMIMKMIGFLMKKKSNIVTVVVAELYTMTMKEMRFTEGE